MQRNNKKKKWGYNSVITMGVFVEFFSLVFGQMFLFKQQGTLTKHLIDMLQKMSE